MKPSTHPPPHPPSSWWHDLIFHDEKCAKTWRCINNNFCACWKILHWAVSGCILYITDSRIYLIYVWVVTGSRHFVLKKLYGMEASGPEVTYRIGTGFSLKLHHMGAYVSQTSWDGNLQYISQRCHGMGARISQKCHGVGASISQRCHGMGAYISQRCHVMGSYIM